MWGDSAHVRLCLTKQTNDNIIAAHNSLFVGYVNFAISKRK